MITEAILNVFRFTMDFLLSVVPSIPSFPSGILSSLTYLNTLVGSVVGFVAYLFTPTLTVFIFTSILVLLNFDNVYKLALWFWHKVRG